jgi:hypothetical protein
MNTTLPDVQYRFVQVMNARQYRARLCSRPPTDDAEPLILLLVHLTAWVKRATTRTNSDRRLHMCPPGRREQEI